MLIPRNNYLDKLETADNYCGMLEEAFIFYRAKGFDTKTKEELVVTISSMSRTWDSGMLRWGSEKRT
jgi:hypothetical protein